jgi:hypothetical protein
MGRGNSLPDDPTAVPDEVVKKELNELCRKERDRVRTDQERLVHTRHLVRLLAELQVKKTIRSATLMDKVEPILKASQETFDYGLAAYTVFKWHLFPRGEDKEEPYTFSRGDTVLEATNKLKSWLKAESPIEEVDVSLRAKPIP